MDRQYLIERKIMLEQEEASLRNAWNGVSAERRQIRLEAIRAELDEIERALAE